MATSRDEMGSTSTEATDKLSSEDEMGSTSRETKDTVSTSELVESSDLADTTDADSDTTDADSDTDLVTPAADESEQKNDTALNGGFETGDFTNWNTIGDASIETAAIGSNPTEGVYQALITTDSGVSVSDAELETFLGLNTGDLDNLGNGDATEGSALQLTSVTAKAGEFLSFDWNFLTSEGTPSFFNDFGFVSISPGSLSELADTGSSFTPSSVTSFGSQTGYGSFSYQFPTDGTYTIGIGVADLQDTAVSSGLLIDNLQVSLPNEVKGTPNDDNLFGTDGIDIISGLGGDDNLFGLGGNDQILGGSGDDLINGGNGNDTVDGEVGDDQISGGAGNDAIKGGDGLDVILGGDGGDRISGGGGKDRIFGEKGNDQINGDDGNDIIDSGEGNDSVSGGNGKDRIFGDSGDDQLSGNAGNDQINGHTGFDALDGGSGDDYLYGGSEDDNLSGGDGVDTLKGGSEFDSLDGGSGNDLLNGVDTQKSQFGPGFGAFEIDILTGGSESDTFFLGDAANVYYDDGFAISSGEFDYALITDFDASEDFIQLKGSANLYSLDLYTSSQGTIEAAIIYDPGVSAKGEVIGILQNVSASLSITDPAFTFV